MNTRVLCSTILVALGLPASLCAQLLVNGGFENGSPLAGWTAIAYEGSIQAVGGPNVSPFTTSSGFSKTAVRLSDGPGTNGYPELAQDFTSSGAVRFSFDFKLSEFSSDCWFVYAGYSESPGFGTSLPFNVLIGSDGAFKFLSSGPGFVRSIELGSWYHVAIDLDFARQLIDGSLTLFGGETSEWSDFTFVQPIPTVNRVVFTDAVREAAQNGDLFLDNVSVAGPTAVPEPATYGWAATGALLSLVAWRRWGRARA